MITRVRWVGHAVESTPLGTYGYDANGNMTHINGVATYGHDGENRLKTAISGATTVTYVYGPDGTRLKKIFGTAATVYVRPDIEQDTLGTITRYLPGDVWNQGNNEHALHRDQVGSLRALDDGGDVEWAATTAPMASARRR